MAAQSVNKAGSASDANITFIVGDARSKQNISRIRSHASRAPKMHHRAATAAAAAATSSSRGVSSRPQPHFLSLQTPPTPPLRSATTAHPQPLLRLSPTGSDDQAESNGRSFDRYSEPRTERCQVARPTRYQTYPPVHVGGSPKRCRYSAYRTSPSSPSSSSSSSPFSSPSLPARPRPGRRQHAQNASTAQVQLPSVFDLVSCASESECCPQSDRKTTTCSLHPRRRPISTSSSPSPPLALCPSQRNFEDVLFRTAAFYTSQYNNKWGPMLSRDSRVFDADGRTGALHDSFQSIASLVLAGRAKAADTIIQRSLAVMEDLFLTEQPLLYNILVVLALNPSTSVLGQIHRQFARAALPIARRTLGDEHPYTKLLMCDFATEMKAPIRKAVQSLIHQLNVAHFGDAFQGTSESLFISGRAMANSGQIDEALDVLAWIKERWERQHGINSMLAVWVLLDEASLYLAAGIADVQTEMVLSDAMRRLNILHANTSRLASAAERQYHRAGIINQKVGALRTFGKLHLLRGNLGAALESYRQAATLSCDTFGQDSPVTQLAQVDLDQAYASGVSRGGAVAENTDPDNLTEGEGEEKVEVVEMNLGPVVWSRVPFGRERVKGPVDNMPKYGLIPYECVRWREGM